MSAMLTVGNLVPEDDYMHPVSADASHNESMFFNFFDSRQRLGGFVRIGNRVNERHAEMTFCLFLPDGAVLMQWGKPVIESNAAFDAAGMTLRVVEPGRRLRVSYAGPAVRIGNPDEMHDPGKAMRSNPTCTTRLDLEVCGSGPMIGDREGNAGSIIFLQGVGHYQQPIAASGDLLVGSERWRLEARGVRDHSWGPRIWHSLYRDRSLWISYGPELSIIACKTWLSATGAPDEMGCVVENGRVTPLRVIALRTHFRAGTFYHDEVILDLTDSNDRSMSLHGKVISYVPLRHRRAAQETLYLGQAMTLFQCGDRRALGLSEYFDAAAATPDLIGISQRGEYLSE
jgi:hypothetical protein